MEIVKVNAASGVGGGEVEQRKPLPYEIRPVKIHLQRVADAFPFLAVKTVIKRSLVGLVTEITDCAQIYAVAVDRDALYLDTL